MAVNVARLGPLSWQQDRVGGHYPGVAVELLTEQIRLGYLRSELGRTGYVSPSQLVALLHCSSGHLLPDASTRRLHPRPTAPSR